MKVHCFVLLFKSAVLPVVTGRSGVCSSSHGRSHAPLYMPAASVCMFGSAPVWTDTIKQSSASIADSLDSHVDADVCYVNFEFDPLEKMVSGDVAKLAHPYLIRSEMSAAAVRSVTICAALNRIPTVIQAMRTIVTDGETQSTNVDFSSLFQDAIRECTSTVNKNRLSVGNAISTMIWNCERLLQAFTSARRSCRRCSTTARSTRCCPRMA